MNMRLIALAAMTTLVSACSTGAPSGPAPPSPPGQSIKERMTLTITPATDTVWGADEPQTDKEWQALDDATVVVIDAFEAVRQGGSGSDDDARAADARFQAYVGRELAAAEKVRAAIAAQDFDALVDAGNELYMPCEECHLEFNPAVKDQQY